MSSPLTMATSFAKFAAFAEPSANPIPGNECGRLAQLVEHRPYKPGVAGSTPAPPNCLEARDASEAGLKFQEPAELTDNPWSRSELKTTGETHRTPPASPPFRPRRFWPARSGEPISNNLLCSRRYQRRVPAPAPLPLALPAPRRRDSPAVCECGGR